MLLIAFSNATYMVSNVCNPYLLYLAILMNTLIKLSPGCHIYIIWLFPRLCRNNVFKLHQRQNK
ncbi:uncharacterized protein DS421_11g322790 [Arachis hypogaea]|nr:uncharacterized protein DS421_11g322790 [Arachis hypogaea]